MAFADEPGVTRIVWLFSLVLGHSRLLWARFVLHQDHAAQGDEARAELADGAAIVLPEVRDGPLFEDQPARQPHHLDVASAGSTARFR